MLRKLSSLVGLAALSSQSQQTLWNTLWTWNPPADNIRVEKHLCNGTKVFVLSAQPDPLR